MDKSTAVKKAVVVGGGIGGWAVMKSLKGVKGIDATLLDKKEYFEVTYAQLRALVDPDGVGAGSRIPYERAFPGKFVQGEATGLEDSAVLLADGARIGADYIVLAPGTRYPRFPMAKPEGQADIQSRNLYNKREYAKFEQAQGFLVVGGGVLGIELAGELVSAAPGKPVRLIHRGPRLAEGLSPRSSAIALRQLQSLGVDVTLNSKESTPLPGDVVYEAVSPQVCTGFVPPALLDAAGRIGVDAHLRVPGHETWYAIGDAAATADPKHGVNAAAQGEYVADHITRTLAGAKRIKPYSAGKVLALVPIGRKSGFLQAPFGTLTWKFLIEMKRKDFFVGRFRRDAGID